MISRNETYLAFINGDEVILPDKPLSRNEAYLAYLCGAEVSLPEKPLSRIETYLAYLCGDEVTLPEKPLSDTEDYLAVLCGQEVTLPIKPRSRINTLLAAIIEGGGLSSGYIVTYYDDDGITVLGTETVEKNGNAAQAPTPTKEATAQYTYTFAGWASEVGGTVDASLLTGITSNVNAYAVYTSVPIPQIIEYTVTYYDEDGITVLGTETVEENSDAVNAPVPAKPDSEFYSYIFAGWASEAGGTVDAALLTGITADISVYAVYTQTLIPQFRKLMSMTAKTYDDKSDASSFAQYCFAYDTVLETVLLSKPAGIPIFAFYRCSALKNAYFPNVRTISAMNSLQGCRALKELRLPQCTSNLAAILTDSNVESLECLDVKIPNWNYALETYGVKIKWVILRRTSLPSSGVTPAFHPDSPIGQGNGYIFVPDKTVSYDLDGDGTNESCKLIDVYKAQPGWSDYAGQFYLIGGDVFEQQKLNWGFQYD